MEVSDLMEYVKAPDFPTGGTIYGYDGVRSAFETGRGRIVIRGKVRFEETSTREQIIVDEIPYMVNKSNMIKQTADLVNSKKLEGIADIRDESDRNGMRIVYDLKRDAIPNIVLNKLYKYTALQSSFSVNNIALVKGRPQLLNLKQLIQLFSEVENENKVDEVKSIFSDLNIQKHTVDLIKAYYTKSMKHLDSINSDKKEPLFKFAERIKERIT